MTEQIESAATETTKTCPYCSELILASAQKCRHCGEFLDEELRRNRVQETALPPPRKWSPGVAAILSFLIPGLGQMYKGQVLNGIFWFVITAIGYFFFIIPGLVLHLFCILGAATGDPYK